jgi:hypothetical protein
MGFFYSILFAKPNYLLVDIFWSRIVSIFKANHFKGKVTNLMVRSGANESSSG